MAVNYRSESRGGGGGGGSRGETVVVDCGRRRNSCGYCRSRNGSSVSHDLRAQSLTVDEYQGSASGLYDLDERRCLEARVQRYMRAVGRELSERMVYSLE